MRDIDRYFNDGAQLVTLNLTYFRPDYTDILQLFVWQTLDIVPDLPRIQRFLAHWHHNIDAAIQSVEVGVKGPSGRPKILTPAFESKLLH